MPLIGDPVTRSRAIRPRSSVERAARTKLWIFQPNIFEVSETFLRAHAERLPADVTVMAGSNPTIGGRPLLSQRLTQRAGRRFRRAAMGVSWERQYSEALVAAFVRERPDVVLAEYGPTGVLVMDACRIHNVPLVVHFHGYDGSCRDVLEQYALGYREMFGQADAVVVVSRAMQQRIVALGCDPRKVHYNTYGVDCSKFCPGEPAHQSFDFLAVGRFVDKKSPLDTLKAFQRVVERVPTARLRMIGDGPLLARCRELARDVNIEHAVSFLGEQLHAAVRAEMQQARCFVQHSVQAPSGDSEGTPVAILEAAACGLPIVATRHAGIADVVLDGQTGFLVNEHDVDAMANDMHHLAVDPELAGELGRAGRRRIVEHFSIERSIAGLWSIIESCARRIGS